VNWPAQPGAPAGLPLTQVEVDPHQPHSVSEAQDEQSVNSEQPPSPPELTQSETVQLQVLQPGGPMELPLLQMFVSPHQPHEDAEPQSEQVVHWLHGSGAGQWPSPTTNPGQTPLAGLPFEFAEAQVDMPGHQPQPKAEEH